MVTEDFCEGLVSTIAFHEDSKSMTVKIRDRAKKNWNVVANGVRDCLVVEMRFQNIIDRISIFDSTDNHAAYAKKVHLLLRGELPEREDDLLSPFIVDLCSEIKSSKLVLLEVEPIYGALVLVSAASVSIALAEI